MKGDLENCFVFSGNQKLNDGGTYRRYELSSAFKSYKSESELIDSMYNLFKHEGSLDDYPVHDGFLYLNFNPDEHFDYTINLSFDEVSIKNNTFFENFVNVLPTLGLFITWGVIWTNVSKQKQRKTSVSWRNKVLKDNVCACCGGDKHLEAHHIFGYAKYEMLKDDPDNGIALCKWCHKKYHSYYPVDANPKDLIKFLKQFGGNYG